MYLVEEQACRNDWDLAEVAALHTPAPEEHSLVAWEVSLHIDDRLALAGATWTTPKAPRNPASP